MRPTLKCLGSANLIFRRGPSSGSVNTSKVDLIAHNVSPLVKIYGPKGIQVDDLLANYDALDRRLILYRNCVRLVKFFNRERYFKRQLLRYIKLRFLDDYNYRRRKLLGIDTPLSESELMQRAVNSVNFLNNSCCVLDDTPSVPNGRQGMNDEFRILDSIIQYENSKLNPRMVKEFGVKTLNDLMNYKEISGLRHGFERLDVIPVKEWYGYIDEFDKRTDEIPAKKLASYDFARVIVTYERTLVRLDEDCGLLL